MSTSLDNDSLIAQTIDELYKICMEAHDKGLKILESKEYDAEALRACLQNKEKIFEVDNEFKLNPFVRKSLQLRDIRMLVGAYHPQIDSIKVTETYGNIKYITEDAKFILTLTLKDGQKIHFFVKSGLENQVKLLINRLPEDNLEVVCRKHVRLNAKLKSSEFWSQYNWEEGVEKYYYDKISDGFMKQRFEENVLPLAQQNQKLVIMDIGGGKGRLASKLIDVLLERRIPFKYILIEPALSQCEVATKLFQENYPEQMNQKDVEVINSTLEEFANSNREYDEYCGKVDAIILSGGPINLEIVGYDLAEEHLEYMQPLLGEHGLIIASGYSPLHFRKKDFKEEYGLEVLGTVKRLSSAGSSERDELHQCYIIKNRPVDIPEASVSNAYKRGT
ncbi:hypothetical protein [Legionella gresilensis]|uniref:hypothetical protein n=1 Tax=Legionella gresilensis TaxID=91823 RepID=UPI00104163B7|nr:hypothetical protein [Legionella gresilensis]